MAEVAIVLAVLPLIISAAEKYKNVYLPSAFSMQTQDTAYLIP